MALTVALEADLVSTRATAAELLDTIVRAVTTI